MFNKTLGVIFFLSIYQILGIFSIQVKITDITVDQLHPSYTRNYFRRVVNLSKTMSVVPIIWDIQEAFPSNYTLTTTVKRYDSPADKVGKILNTFVMHPCDMYDEWRPYLPTFLLEWTAEGKCIQPDKLFSDDSGQFKFYQYLPESQLKGAHKFVSTNTMQSNRGVIIKYYITSIPI